MEKSGIRETKWLFFILMISHISLESIRFYAEEFATGAPAGLVLSLFFALAIAFFVEKWGDLNCGTAWGKSLFEKRTAYVLGIILFVITLFNTAGRMKEFSAAIEDTVLLKSPRVFILILMAGAGLGAGFAGHEAITRYASLVSMAFLLFLGVLVVTNVSGTEAVNLYPLGGKNGLFNPLKGMYIFSDGVYFLFIKSWFKNSEKINYPLTKTIGAAGLCAFVLTFFYCLCVPYPASSVYKYPVFRLSVLANSSVLFQRLDGFLYLVWIFFSFICTGAFVLFSVSVLSETLGLKNKKAVCPIVVLLCFLISLWKVDFTNGIKIIMSLFSFVVVPGAVLVIKLWRRKNA